MVKSEGEKMHTDENDVDQFPPLTATRLPRTRRSQTPMPNNRFCAGYKKTKCDGRDCMDET